MALGRIVVSLGTLVFLVARGGFASGGPITTTLVSAGLGGAPADDSSFISSSGLVFSESSRWLAFDSEADNITPADTNGHTDIFVRDIVTRNTVLASVSVSGAQGDGDSVWPAISGSGRFVVFQSDATNLVAHDHNPIWSDVFVHDLLTGRTNLIDLSTFGQQGDDGPSFSASISANGRFVAFASVATNLVLGDSNNQSDVFVRDRKTHRTERVSVSSTGDQGDDDSLAPEISADGRFVAFYSVATNLVVGDTNGAADIFVHDRATGSTERVSVTSFGDQANDGSFNAGVSSDGRYVAFNSIATNLVLGDTNATNDVFVRDRSAGTTERVSVSGTGQQGNGQCGTVSISADGRLVAFDTYSDNLVPNDTNGQLDVFVHDRATGATARVSVSVIGDQSDGASTQAELSPDGRFAGFYSNATNLVPGDTNGFGDVFVRGPLF